MWTQRHAALEGRLFRFGVTGKNGESGGSQSSPFQEARDAFSAPGSLSCAQGCSHVGGSLVWSGGSSWPWSRVSLCPCSEEHVEGDPGRGPREDFRSSTAPPWAGAESANLSALSELPPFGLHRQPLTPAAAVASREELKGQSVTLVKGALRSHTALGQVSDGFSPTYATLISWGRSGNHQCSPERYRNGTLTKVVL